MTKRLLIALLATVLCLSVVLLAACGCEHFFENGTCKYCGEVDPNFDPNNMPCAHYFEGGQCKYCGEEDPNYDPNDFACAHYYVNGACKYCAEVDANWQEPICQHYYVNGVCNKCGDVDTNYIPVTPPSDTEKTATSIRVLGKYGKNGQTANVAGTVFAVDTK